MTNMTRHSPEEIDRSRAIAPQVYDYLRARIVDNRLPPDMRISEGGLSCSLDISRTPLRAALQQLANEGLIQTRPQVGSVVAPLNETQLEEVVRIRIALEVEVVRRLAEKRAVLDALEPILATQKRAAELDDYATFFPQDEAFHAALAGIAGMPNAWRLAHSIKGHVDRQRYQMMSGIPMRSQRAYDEHLKVIEKICAGDGDGAAEAMRDHINSVLELIEQTHSDDEPPTTMADADQIDKPTGGRK